MSYTEPKDVSENTKRKINLDEVIDDEFGLSKKKKPMNDSDNSDQKPSKKVNLNEDM